MNFIPYIRIAKPIRIVPISRFLFVFPVITMMMPTSAMIGLKDSGFSIRTNTLLLEMPIILMIHAVTVVPMFEPIITPMVLEISIIPELTRPTSMTVTAEEL